MKNSIRKIGFAILAIAASLQAVAADDWHFDDVDRVVAFSDIHGAYDAMVQTLQSANVIDASLAWSGGSTHLVLIGDILDRGPDSRAAMDLLIGMEQEAAQAGGMVHVLLGNHEVMNLVGDVRYVARQEYAAFADDELPEDRDFWFAAYRSKRAGQGEDEADLRTKFDRAYPAGFFAHRKAFAPDGKYGAWLLTKPMIVVVNSTAFVHGGLSPIVAEFGLPGTNGELRGEISLYANQLEVLFDEQLLLPTDANNDHVELLESLSPDATRDSAVTQAIADILRLNELLFSYQSPHWYRGHTYCGEITESSRIDAALQKINASRVVVGHTPTPNREVVQRLGGRVIEVDTGMLSSYYRGSGHALIIEGDEISVINQDGSKRTQPVVSERQVGSRPDEPMSVEEIEELLSNGRIVPVGYEDGYRVQLNDGEQTIEATFVQRRRKGVYPDVAAYRLDRLLNLEMVPATVIREFEGNKGSLQFVPVGTMSEDQRRLDESGGGAWCPLRVQWNSMMIFDALAANESRTGDTLFYNQSNWQVIMTGFNDAFTVSTSKPAYMKDTHLELGSSWQAALNSLNDEQLQESFGDILSKRQVKALGKRRDMLLSQ